MNSRLRRGNILILLKEADRPYTGTELSERFRVTRQVVVSDVAILRAAGEQIIATPQGYLYNGPQKKAGATLTVVSRHSADSEEIRAELYTIVDQGGVVLDVTVEHPLYGEITAVLNVASRYDADRFINKMRASRAEPLLVLTDGVHLHSILVKDSAAAEAIKDALEKKGLTVLP